jgi:signal transduction histidine kinase
MQERAALLGGELSVESIPGRGTRIAAVFPVSPAEGVETP